MTMLYLTLLSRAVILLFHFKVGNAGSTTEKMKMYRVAGRRSLRNGGFMDVGFTDHNGISQFHYRLMVASKIKTWRRTNTSRRFHLSAQSDIGPRPIKSVAIVGGGLAGLSTAYHLLDMVGNENEDVSSSMGLQITIYDKANVGEGGASSVAGGLIHPFSPRGKLIHFGLLALDHSNHLIQMASKHPPHQLSINLTNRIYRVALSPQNAAQLQHTAENYPDLASWISREEIHDKFDIESLGALELGNGCKVIHVPTYLSGLWEECQKKANEINGIIKWELIQIPTHEVMKASNTPQNEVEERPIKTQKDTDLLNQQLARFDAVILSAGAALLQDGLISKANELPVQLVRGQSIEISLPSTDHSANNVIANEAFLCGKYVSPLTNDSSSQRFVVGATHEFKPDALDPTEVVEELKNRTYLLARHLWDNGSVDRLTTGVRMQSNRGSYGRMPIIGRYNATTMKTAIRHKNCWIFTGLSSRGLIYHGLFGRWLADSVLHDEEEKIREQFAEFDWWRKK